MISQADYATNFVAVPLETGGTEETIMTTRSGLTYKKLPEPVFYWTAIMLQSSLLIMAISVQSIDSVFDFVGAFGSGCISFLFPGVAYLYALHSWGSGRVRKQWQTLFNQIVAWFFIIMFVVVLSLYIWVTILKASGKVSDETEGDEVEDFSN